MMSDKALRIASFQPGLFKYYMLNGTVTLLGTIVGIPLIPLWLLFGSLYVRKYISRLSCVLTERDLIVKRGIIFRVERNVPLEKITDLALNQGPVMRLLGLEGFKVETAGQSSGPGGSLIGLVGLVDLHDFRDAVLAQRDRISDRTSSRPSSAGTESEGDPIMTDIRDT
ncbi:MAG: PH domain-containing protein, partial [Phycisphaerales bacterium]|nr:PH domain-containing protein [Phycisphaerales bacterium]